MERNEFIKGIADYQITPDIYAKRQGNIAFVDLYGEDDMLHFDIYIDDRCYRQDATYLQPAEDGYAVDAVAINWSAFNEKTFHLTDDEKKGLEGWFAGWLAENWEKGGSIARQATELSMWGFLECSRAQRERQIN